MYVPTYLGHVGRYIADDSLAFSSGHSHGSFMGLPLALAPNTKFRVASWAGWVMKKNFSV